MEPIHHEVGLGREYGPKDRDNGPEKEQRHLEYQRMKAKGAVYWGRCKCQDLKGG